MRPAGPRVVFLFVGAALTPAVAGVAYCGGFAFGGRLAAARGSAADSCPTPSIRIEASSPRPKQGGIVAVTLSSSVPLASADLTDGEHRVAMEKVGAGDARLFHALWGIDFESALGERPLRVEAVGLCGDAHSASRDLRVASGQFPQQKLTVDPAYVEPPPSELERIASDRKKVGRVWASPPSARRWDGPFHLPVDAPIRPNFGARRTYNGKKLSSHGGADLAAPSGAPVAAPAPATVMLAEDLYYSGGTVILDHGSGLFTTYFHLSRIDAKVGTRLQTGEILGAVGATGRVTGPHLHWGARVNGARVNPLDLLELPSWPPGR